MLKRLDWLYLKGQDGGASSDSDSDTDSSDSDKRPQKRQGVPL